MLLKRYEIGKRAEAELIHKIGAILSLDEIEHSSNKYSPYDFIGLKDDLTYFIELKKRSIKLDKYDSLLINECKIRFFEEQLEDENNKCYIFYQLDDGLFYVEITKDNIESILSVINKTAWNNQNVCNIETKTLVKCK